MSASPPARPEAILRRLEWTVMRRLDGLLHGDYRTLFRGFGLDLADLREYQYHDDVRHIDWNVTARCRRRTCASTTRSARSTAWFLLDLSPSVDFGSRRACGSASCRGRVRDGARAAADAPRQSRRRAVLRRPGRHGDPRAQRPARTCCTCCTAMLLAARARRSRAATDLGAFLRGACQTDAAALAGVRRLRLHQHARLGRAARAPRAAPRGDRGAALRSARDGAARPRAARRCRTPRPASSSSSTRTTAASASASRPPRRSARDELRAAFAQAGVDALELCHRRRPRRRDHALRRPAQAPQPARRRRRAAAATCEAHA